MRCHLTVLDGSYVLGALAPAERREFSEHLIGCVECSTSVQEVAGLPGLLAQVDLADLDADSQPASTQVPSSLLPSLVREVRRSRRRRMALVAAVAASSAAVVVGALSAGGALDDLAAPAPEAASISQPPLNLPMVAMVPTPVSGEVLISPLGFGTRLELTCAYDYVAEDQAGEYVEEHGEHEDEEYGSETSQDAASQEAESQYAAPQYALVVRAHDGRIDEVATWPGVPGSTMQLSAVTALSRSDIEAVEVQTADGMVVLRARI